MRRGMIILICILLAVAPCAAGSSQEDEIGKKLRDAQAQYVELSKQADLMLKEAVTVPVPPSTSVSCADEGKTEADSQSLNSFLETFRAPEGPLCAQMLEVQRQLQLLGSEPDYTREAALMNRLGQKALTLIKDYGSDLEKMPAIAMAAVQAAKDIQVLGEDQAGNSTALMDAISAMYEKAIDELFRMLTEKHDYGTVRAILDAARASLLLSGTSGIDIDELLSRLQKALRFELTINYDFEQTGNHRWAQQAVFEVAFVYEDGENSRISGTGTGSLLSFVWDDDPDFTVVAPDFPVQAVFERFEPCDASVELLLTPFHPLTETAYSDGEAIDWPLLKISWEVAFEENLQEDGLYRFPLTLHNLDSNAVNETIEYSVPSNEVKMEILLVHKPTL